jgi:sialate O-acetylesterase
MISDDIPSKNLTLLFPPLIILLIFIVFPFEVKASGLTLHQLFSSHMVLQHDADDPIWGWASPGTMVTVKVYDQNSVLLQTKTGTSGADSKWIVTVGPFGLVANNAAYSITISDGTTTITVGDVLIGDVLLCTGQSNMQYSLNTIGVTNLSAEIADAQNYPNIRCFTVPTISAFTPQTNLPPGTTWQVTSWSTVGNFSATAYFTARELYKQQRVPVGMLCSSWAGSAIKSWLNTNYASTIADFTNPSFDDTATVTGRDTISGPYNAMIAPLAPFQIKAVEWYQGESDVSWPERYSRLLPGLISTWRAQFGQPNLPFIIIQLSSINGAQTLPVETGSWAELREAQEKAVRSDPYSRLVTTIDIGAGQLHPTDKQDVGLRAAWAAADLIYGLSSVDQPPIMTNAVISGSSIICTFKNVGAGLMVGTKSLYPLSPAQLSASGSLDGFAISGSDKVFYTANAAITASNQVTVFSPSVPAPVAVRYAWGGNPVGNLYNKITDGSGNVTNGIPAGCFRNDPVNLLQVTVGAGTGYYASNQVVSISGSNLVAETFLNWSGDTNLLSGFFVSSATATQAQEYVSVLANYQITGAPPGFNGIPYPSAAYLNWTPLPSAHYNIKRSTSSGGPYSLLTSNVNSANYTDNNLAPGTTYYYIIAATNRFGEGPYSSQISVVPGSGISVGTKNWDANGVALPSPSDGSGNWFGSSNWWNGATNVTGYWSGNSLDSASFGAGVSGIYMVDLDGSSVSASNLTFTSSGYTLTNGSITLLGTTSIVVNAGVTTTLQNSLTAQGTISVGAGGKLSLMNGAAMNGSLMFKGGGTVDLNSGAFSGANFTFWTQTPVTLEAADLTTARFLIGYAGNSTFTVNDSTARVSTTAGGDSLIGRAGNIGIFDLKAGSVAMTGAVNDNLRICFDSISKGTLSIEGGSFNLGNNTVFINSGGTGSSGSGTLNITGGTLTAGSVQFGGGGAYSAGSTATFNMSGGTFWVGAGGIATNYTGTLATVIQLSGGTIGASSTWSSSMAMNFNNPNGITFQAADAGNNAKDISLSGSLSGTAGLTKTGSGVLMLAGTNRFTGPVLIDGGTLSILATNNTLRSYINNGSILKVGLIAAGTSLPAGSMVFNGNSPQLTFDVAKTGNATVPVITCGDLTMNTNVTIDITNAPTSGTSALIAYTGARTGAGKFLAGTVPPNASIVDDIHTKIVSLTYLPPSPPLISPIHFVGSSVILSGSGGAPFSAYRVLWSTNIAAPTEMWLPVWSNTFDADGQFNANLQINSNPINFYQLVTP